MADRERVLDTLRELELADTELAGALAALEGLARENELLRLHALDVIALRERLPGLRDDALGHLEAWTEEVEAARAQLIEAERAVEASSQDAKRDAERFRVRARDRLGVAERRQREAEARVAKVQSEAVGAERDAAGLEERTRSLAETLRDRARLADAAGVSPDGGLFAIVQWSEGARAALFVARGQLAAERDALIRQANELGTAVVGEPFGAVSAAAVVRRVEGAIT